MIYKTENSGLLFSILNTTYAETSHPVSPAHIAIFCYKNELVYQVANDQLVVGPF